MTPESSSNPDTEPETAEAPAKQHDQVQGSELSAGDQGNTAHVCPKESPEECPELSGPVVCTHMGNFP